jgi:hypothetical protein
MSGTNDTPVAAANLQDTEAAQDHDTGHHQADPLVQSSPRLPSSEPELGTCRLTAHIEMRQLRYKVGCSLACCRLR